MKTLPIIFKYEDIKEFYPNVTAFYAFVNRASKRGEIRQIKRGIYDGRSKQTIPHQHGRACTKG